MSQNVENVACTKCLLQHSIGLVALLGVCTLNPAFVSSFALRYTRCGWRAERRFISHMSYTHACVQDRTLYCFAITQTLEPTICTFARKNKLYAFDVQPLFHPLHALPLHWDSSDRCWWLGRVNRGRRLNPALLGVVYGSRVHRWGVAEALRDQLCPFRKCLIVDTDTFLLQ